MARCDSLLRERGLNAHVAFAKKCRFGYHNPS